MREGGCLMPYIMPPPEGKANGYSVWLMPNDADGHLCAWLIRRCAQYSGLLFPPHCTLVGNIVAFQESVLLELFYDLARTMPPIAGRLISAKTEDVFFRAVYALFKDPAPIIRERRAVRERLGSIVQPSIPPPHVSILYGTYGAVVKEKVCAMVQDALPWRFHMDTLAVMRTEGTVSEWKIVERFPLGGT